ncbi:NAD(P)-binding domain-containing protein [Paenibacillus sp. JDR-2]|uniref:NAD(P)-binding domain-containing protein n=1 Tax=Paenibacillus sp. (strain JDR-2) TaxID=324057 RepID=UPI00223FE4A2|nr:NAD(P)-binding domain-containing protein [Paenibacillus sp. JDR-2]
MAQIALIGAGGKMGCRITDNMRKGDHFVSYVEIGSKGIERLAERGIVPVRQEEAVPDADVIILAVPDVAIGQISAAVVPLMKAGALLLLLDPAAAFLGELPSRSDISYFVAHPCHPPVFNDEIRWRQRGISLAGWRPNRPLCVL